MKRFDTLTIALIDEGEFLRDIDSALVDAQEGLLAHMDEYKEAAIGAKAKVTVEIELIKTEVEATVNVKAGIKIKLPGRLATVSIAMADEDATGRPRLLVPLSGSTSAPPKQSRLCTQDGRPIDPVTGEIIEGASQEAEKDATAEPTP